MKCLIVSQIYRPQKEGGAERVARRTAEYMRNHGHEVHMLSTRDEKGPPSELDLDIPVHRVEYRNSMLPGIGPTHLSLGAKALWHARNAIGGVRGQDVGKVLAAVKPDVIYLHNAYLLQPQLGEEARKAGIPVVLHMHDYSWMCANIGMVQNGENCEKPCKKCRILTSAWKKSMHPSDIIAVSEFVRDRYHLHGIFPQATWHVVRNTEESASGYEAQKPCNDTFTFGFMGSIVPDKGIEILLEAYATLPKGSAKLVVAGSGEESYVAGLKERTKSLDVTWLGHVPKDSFYDQVDVVVVPSLWHEPQALVLVESIRRQRPVIASRRGGNTEVVEKIGAGLIFEPSEPTSLQESLRKIQSLMSQPEGHGFTFSTGDVLPSEEAFGQSVENVLNAAAANRG